MFNRLGVLACGCATDYCFLYSRSTGWWLLRPPGARKGQEMRAAKLCCRGERCEAWGEPSRQSRRGCLAGIDIDSMLPSVCCRLLQYNPLALVRSCAGSLEQAVNATATQPPHGLNDPQTAWDKAIVSTWNDGFNQRGMPCRLSGFEAMTLDKKFVHGLNSIYRIIGEHGKACFDIATVGALHILACCRDEPLVHSSRRRWPAIETRDGAADTRDSSRSLLRNAAATRRWPNRCLWEGPEVHWHWSGHAQFQFLGAQNGGHDGARTHVEGGARRRCRLSASCATSGTLR